MKPTLPLAVLVAYLLTCLSFGSDGGGPLAMWLPLFAAANFGAFEHGSPVKMAAIVGVIAGFGGLIVLLGYTCRLWRNRWGVTVACGAMLASIAAFATGVPSPALTLETAIPFIFLSLLLLRRQFTAVRQDGAKP